MPLISRCSMIVEVERLVGGKEGLYITSLRKRKICLANEFVLLSFPLMKKARKIQVFEIFRLTLFWHVCFKSKTIYFSGGRCFDRFGDGFDGSFLSSLRFIFRGF